MPDTIVIDVQAEEWFVVEDKNVRREERVRADTRTDPFVCSKADSDPRPARELESSCGSF